MPITTEDYDLEDEYDSLNEQIDALDDELDEYDEETPHYRNALAAKDELVRRRRGFERFSQLFPETSSITLAELNAGEYAALEKHLPTDHTQQEYNSVMTAVSTVEGPYVTGGDVEDTLQTVVDDVPPYFTRWVADKADALLRTEEVTENPFSESQPEE